VTAPSSSTWSPADEGPHPAGNDPWWAECWAFDAWTPDAGMGASTCLVLLPNRQRAWYWAALVRRDEPLLSVVDLDQTPPLRSLRVRRGSLWADHQCEAPFEQWTVVNETYAVALDDPAEALRRGLGEPVPVAFDLEWYATAAPTERAEDPDAGPRVRDGYEQAGEVHGEIELRGGPVTLEGPGHRVHWWGRSPWFDAAWGEVADGLHAPVLLQDGDRAAELHRALTPSGWVEWNRPR
jgi:hypothetical protein